MMMKINMVIVDIPKMVNTAKMMAVWKTMRVMKVVRMTTMCLQDKDGLTIVICIVSETQQSRIFS